MELVLPVRNVEEEFALRVEFGRDALDPFSFEALLRFRVRTFGDAGVSSPGGAISRVDSHCILADDEPLVLGDDEFALLDDGSLKRGAFVSGIEVDDTFFDLAALEGHGPSDFVTLGPRITATGEED